MRSKFNSILFHSKRIVIYGHSVHGIDYDYYRTFLSEPRNDKKIYIIVNKESSAENIKKCLLEQGCKAIVKYLIVDKIDTEKYKKLCEDIIHDTVDNGI